MGAIERGRTARSPMSRSRRTAVAILGVATVGLTAAGCASAINSLHSGREKVTVADNPALGTIVVGDNGRTVYLFVKDPPERTTCYGACASIWPPVTTAGPPSAGSGVPAGKVTVIRRSDGISQVVYDGHPLYYYQADTGPGDAYGEGLNQFGAEWYAQSPTGQPAEAKKGGGGSS